MKYFYSVLFFFISFFIIAQEQPINSNPNKAIKYHLENLQDDQYIPEEAAKIIHPEIEENRKSLAVKLKHVLDGQGLYIDLDIVPKDNNYFDSLSNANRYYLARERFPDLYVEKVGDKWFYSKKSVLKIEEWHNETFPFGTDKLMELLPKNGHKKMIGLYVWQYVGIFLLIALTFVLHKIFSFIIEKVFIRFIDKLGFKHLADKFILPAARPISVLVIFPILIILIPVLQLPIKINSFILIGLKAVWPVFAIIFFYRVVDIFSKYLEKVAAKTESTLDDQLVPLLRKTLKSFVVIIGILIILSNLNVNIFSLVAGLSIGGLAFALAAQDTIKNFFGSLMIFFDRPFQVGDWITSGDIDGTIEEVGFRATRIRTFRNSVMYIPNGLITNQMIDNHGLRVYRRFYTTICITYDTPPELIEAFTEGLRKIVLNHPQTRKDVYEIYLNNLSDSSLDIMFYIFFQTPNWSDELKGRHEVILEILKLAKHLGVDFAFPTQSLHVETVHNSSTSNRTFIQDPVVLNKKTAEFFKEKG